MAQVSASASDLTIGNNDNFDIVFAMRVHLLALNGVFDTGLALMMDAFQTANELAEMTALTTLRFDVTVVGARKSVRTSLGLSVPVTPASRRVVPDVGIIPAIGYKMPGPLVEALARPEMKDAGRIIQNWAERGATVAAACIGTFVLAETGLMEGRDSTTTWWLAPLFRQRYPGIRLDESHMVVKSGKFVTAGAALSHMDLALSLIRQKSPKLAALTARYMIVDTRPTQSAYILTDHLNHSDPMVEQFERWARGRLAQGFSLDDAARAVGASKRTLARRMDAVMGKSPLAYFQDLRVEHSVHLLKTSDRSIEEIAQEVGYSEGVTLRTLLRRRLGHGIREIRKY
jgi:transcriptional regulator GlxA family with amidase domain